VDKTTQEEMAWLVELISEIRSRRAEFNVPAATQMPLEFYEVSPIIRDRVDRHTPILKKLGRISELRLNDGHPESLKGAVQFIIGETTLLLPLAGSIDLSSEVARFQQEIAALDKEIKSLEGRLANQDFMKKAKPEVVEETQERLSAAQLAKEKMTLALARLG
jgi:valyl-tRNA synthetase